MSNVTVVVQGPQSSTSISAANAHNYVQYGDVVVSCWEGNDSSGVIGLPGARVVSQPLPRGGALNPQNIYYQCMSTLRGLQEVRTEYAIKVRSDEAYSDLSPVINLLVSSPGKIITNNVYFRRTSEFPFHPSDHLIAGRTKSLIGSFSILKDSLEQHENSAAAVAEQRIMLSFLRYHGILADKAKAREIMRRWVDVVPIDKLGLYIWSDWNGAHRDNPHYIQTMDDI
jgi:hypothetical protein